MPFNIKKNVDPPTVGFIINEVDLGIDINAKELSEHHGHLRMEACLQAANRKNRNGRQYDSEDLFPAINAPRVQELLKALSLKGENGHPLSKDLSRQSIIDPNNTVVVFEKLWTEGELIKTIYHSDFNQLGDDMDRQIRAGQVPAFSLRALGALKPATNINEGTRVKNIKIVTYDKVLYPSHPEAYTTGFVNETVELTKDGIIIPIINEQVEGFIREQSNNMRLLKECEGFLYENIDVEKYRNSSRVRLMNNDGSIIYISLESYVHEELMHGFYNKYL